MYNIFSQKISDYITIFNNQREKVHYLILSDESDCTGTEEWILMQLEIFQYEYKIHMDMYEETQFKERRDTCSTVFMLFLFIAIFLSASVLFISPYASLITS